MKKISCAFTGHRPSRFKFGYDEDNEGCQKLKAAITEWVDVFIANGIKNYLSGFALGVDTWAAEIVLEMKKKYEDVKLTAVIPCETQAHSWSIEQQERYYNLQGQCDDVIILNTKYTRSCMFERNRYLIDHADYLLAVYDGSGKGGTAYTVEYGQKKDRKITVIHPDSLEIVSFETINVLRNRALMRTMI